MSNFELLKPFRVETRRLLWLVGLVFATVILFQCIELPKGNALWSIFTRSEFPDQKTRRFFGDNTTSSLSNAISPTPSVVTHDENMNNNYSSVRVDGQNSPFMQNPSNNTIYKTKNSSSSEPRKDGLALPQGQNGNFTLASTTPRAAPPPWIPVRRVPPKKPMPKKKPKSKVFGKKVYTLSDMTELLNQNMISPPIMMPRWPSKVDKDLVVAKHLIENLPPLKDDGLYAPLYRNASRFQRSYELMEQMLKVYIYQEGDRRIFHRPPLQGIYASEGWFMKHMEANRHFVTKRPKEAHLFYLPFSSRQLEEALYVPGSHSRKNLVQHLKEYVDLISSKYSFWNRTDGSDHFLVACHDWAPSETKDVMANCVRALCNADVRHGFKFGKDMSLPETMVRKAKNPLRDIGGKPTSKRLTLAFFAGQMHGYLRPILIQYWGNNKDPDMKIFSEMPRSKDNRNYINYMQTSKYCICPRGYEVNSPRVIEAIFYECVPVIISDNFVPPFFETLNWESFAVFVAEKDIPNLKNILVSIPEKTFFRMRMRVKKVQQHFLWHPKPIKYDLFHMVLHSIWYNRVFQFRPR